MTDQKNTILAIALSAVLLIAWQYFFGIPQMEKQKQAAELQRQQQQAQTHPAPAGAGTTVPAPQTPAGTQSGAQAPGAPGTAPALPGMVSRESIINARPHVAINTPRVQGSIALKGARLDDLSLVQFRETVDPKSPAIVLLAPSGSLHPFYAEFGWVPNSGTTVKLPGPDTIWRQEGSGTLGIGQPVTLAWNNDEGLTFRRKISVDA